MHTSKTIDHNEATGAAQRRGDVSCDARDLSSIRTTLKNELHRLQHGWDLGAGMFPACEQRGDVADRAGHEMHHSLDSTLRGRKHERVVRIERALSRLDRGEYGICEECGEDIAPARLRARPTTALCLACKHEQEEDAARRCGQSMFGQ